MRTEKREVIVKKFEEVYIAADGTEFGDTQMCREYERTAKCAVFSTYNKLVVGTISEYDLFAVGNEDNVCEIVKLSTTEDVETVMRALFCIHSTTSPDDEWAKAARQRADAALTNNELLIVCRGYDPDDSFWIIGGMTEIKNRIENAINNANKC